MLQNLRSSLSLENFQFSSTHQKDLKLSQYLDIDDITSPTKLAKSHDLVRILQTVLYFTDYLFSAIFEISIWKFDEIVFDIVPPYG